MHRRVLSLLSLLFLTSTTTFVADAQGTQRATLEPYKIGLTVPLTGPLAANAAEYIPGAEIAVADINKSGGIKGHPIQLVVEDTQASPQGGVAAMRKLVDVDHVPAIITIFTSVVTAQMPLADQLKVPILSPIETPGVMVRAQYAFAHSARYDLVAPLLQAYWKAKGVKRIFAFLGNNAQGAVYGPLVKATALAAGAEYQEALINLTDTDFRGVATRAKEFNPDAVFFEASGSQAETTVIRQVREVGITAQYYSDSNFFQTRSWRLAVGPYSEGMISGGLKIDESFPHGKVFANAYRAKTGQPPGYVPGEFYDMVQMLAQAMRTGGYNGEGIRTALVSLKGLPSIFGGNINMGESRYTEVSAEALWQVRQGRQVRLDIPGYKP
jgi:branched-chain amino acid transport system substrate-binding protein